MAELSKAIRQSTLKRLLQVPRGKENWRPSPGGMTFAEIARHICEADQWLFRKLKEPTLSKMVGKAGESADVTTEEYQEVVAGLRASGQQRDELLSTLTDAFLDSPIYDDRFGEVTVWWVIVRGNLDHEAHHRGQLAVYFRFLQNS